MKCPYCNVLMVWKQVPQWDMGLRDPEKYAWLVEALPCPGCEQPIVYVVRRGPEPAPTSLAAGATYTDPPQAWPEARRIQVWPRGTNRPPCPPEVPDAICQDYREACLVLEVSPKASAALSRRCLQHILRSGAAVKHGDLATEIDQVLASRALPSMIADSLDYVRVIGNFAAHPTKSKTTGAVLDVEPGEADWTLDVIEALMDVLFVQPAMLAAKKAALNAKLAAAGKNPLP